MKLKKQYAKKLESLEDLDAKNTQKMKKFRVYYWKYKNDDYQDFEVDIIANNFDEAYLSFKDSQRMAKIRCIKEIV